MPSSWRIELFGGLRLSCGERSFALLQAPKAGLLLAYLAYFPGHPQPRELLLELLWPESDPETSRHNLRSLLHAIRRQLEPAEQSAEPLLVAERAALRLNPSAFHTDVAEFAGALQKAARTVDLSERADLLAEAVALYRGELLAGFYEPWVLTERQRLEEEYLGALQQLVLALEERGELEQAIEYARRGVSADPLREEAHYDLMRLYAAAGQPSATLRQYHELERLLREELGETPSAATRALAEELRQNARTIVVARSLGNRERESGERCLPHSESSAPIPETGAAGSRPADHSVVAHPPEIGEPPATVPAPAAVPHGLPVQFTRFFGREEEIARVTETLCIPEARLVTLTGPGGIGKTRLAIAVAGRLQAQFAVEMAGAIDPAGRAQDEPASPGVPPIGLWFVPLAEIADARRIGDAVRDAMRLPPAATGEPLEQVIAALSTRSTAAQPGHPPSGRVPSGAGWLLLDNFEHLVDEGAPLVRHLLERVPSLKLLITSRQSLRLGGEHEFPVLPLAVPEGSDPPACLLACSSVALYVDRAQSVRPDFSLTPQNAAAVGALCRKLEGMPLAIEMAAAWAKTLPPARMLERLEDKLDLLVSRQRGLPPRQQSLRATFEWSYELLSPEQQACFAQLSVFRGGWTLEAAERVTEASEGGVRSGAEALMLLSELQEQSLIVVEEREEETRFRLLEPLREYAGEKLAERKEREAVRARHAAYFLTLAETQHRGGGPAEGRWLDCMEREYENLRAAREWFADAGRPELELRLAEVAQYLRETRGHGRDARGWLEHALGGLIERDEARARALHLAGRMAYHDDDAALAQRCWEESLAIMREVENKQGMANALNYLGNIAYVQQDYDTARALWEESLAIMRELNDKQGMAHCLVNLGGLAHMQGDTAAARRFWEECRALDEAMGIRGGHVLWLLGVLAREQGDAAEARRLWRQHLMESQDFKARCVTVLGELASFAVEDGELEQGARLWGAVSALRERRDLSLRIVLSETYEQSRSLLRAQLGEAAFEAAFAQGRALTLEQAIECAVAGPM